MPEWTNRVETHQINSQLHQIKELLEQVEQLSEDQVDSLEDHNRLYQIISFIDSALSNADPMMVANPTLNNLSKHSQNVIVELEHFISNKNVAHLVNANNHADHLLIQGKMLLSPTHLSDVENIRDSIGNFRKSAGQYLRHVEEDSKQLQTQIQELSKKSQEITNDINIQKGRLDTAITQFQQQFSDSAEKRREQSISAEKERSDEHKEAISKLEEQFIEISNEKNREFKVFQNEISSKMNSSITKLDGRLDSINEKAVEISVELRETADNQIKAFTHEAEKIIKELNAKKEHASSIVGIIGNIGVTGNFKKIANEEKDSADSLRRIALLLMTGMVLVIALTIGISAQNGFDWKLSIFRLATALVLAIPATYAASESSKHRVAEYRNRQAELELASIDPFLENMPDGKKYELKANLTEKLFGNSNLEEIKSEEVKSSSLLKLLKLAIENLTNK